MAFVLGHPGARIYRTIRGGLFLVAISLGALAALPVHSQTAQPGDQKGVAFDAASIKANTSGSGASTIGFEQGGRFLAVNMPVASLIQTAYATAAVPRPQIVGSPGWIDSDRFDVTAVTDRNPSQDERQMMLRALLVDRFKLAIHRDTRELPIYNLVKASRDGKLGSKLRVSNIDCAALRKGVPDPEQLRPCMMAFGLGSLQVSGITASQFATGGLARLVNRPVFDRTGLGATLYDWALDWTPDQSNPGLPSSIFSAIQEQLGLKLESAKGAIDVLVIDHVERPTPD
jgi:uncharacterized protein (TIGR03435 family)